MSWNIQRPDGVGGMAPSESQAYMSHEQLLSNRDGETDKSCALPGYLFSSTFPFVLGLEIKNK